MLNSDFSTFCALCAEKKVRYLIVGGYAVAAHGYPRFTGDIDIWFEQSEENVRQLLDVIREFGFGSLGIQEKDLLEPEVVLQMGHPPRRIDLIADIDGVSFDEAYLHKMTVREGELELHYIGKTELIENKKATGRYRDLDDLEHLA